MVVDDESPELLAEVEAWALLGGEDFGRVAVCQDGMPAIFPVNFGVVDGSIVFRTSTGTKLTAAATNAVMAFEVDHRDRRTHSGWSVVVVGVSEVVHDVELLLQVAATRLEPEAGGRRGHLVRIRPDKITGRRIATEV